MSGYKERKDCRICKGKVKELLTLGDIYTADFIENAPTSIPSPLTLIKCEDCGLIQLKHTVDQDVLYDEYWYKSALNSDMVDSLQDIVSNVEAMIDLEDGDIVVDIGANDGTMLSMYKNKNLETIGIDPAKNLKVEAEPKCSLFINDYFSYELLQKQAKVITSIAMFYDLEDPNSFVADIKKTLLPNGLWVIQMTDLKAMLDLTAFDNICHEHLEYYSLTVLQSLLNCHGLDIFKVSTNAVNGGSLRAYVCYTGERPIDKSVGDYLKSEESLTEDFEVFVERIKDIRDKIMFYVKDNVLCKGERVYVLGASTKGNTLLQYFGLDNALLPKATEVNKDKFGRRTIKTNIPIFDEKEIMANDPPEHFLVLPWHFIHKFIDWHKPYLKSGGRLVVPCPKPAVYFWDGEAVVSKELGMPS